MKLSQAVEVFLNDCKRRATRVAYSYVLTRLLEGLGRLRPVDAITPMDMKLYDQHLVEAYPNPGTLIQHRRVVKVFFNWCVDNDLAPSSPARKIKTGQQPRSNADIKAMTDQELDQFLAYARYHPRLLALVLFLADTGCRIGGATGLRWADLCLPDQSATVEEKGQPRRVVVFGDPCACALAALPQTHLYVFGTSRAATPSATTLSNLFVRGAQKAGLRHVTPHMLRHRKGHQLADSGTPVSVAALAMGHTRPEMFLNVYARRDQTSVIESMRNLTVRSEEEPSPKIIRLPRNA
jgi:integrase